MSKTPEVVTKPTYRMNQKQFYSFLKSKGVKTGLQKAWQKKKAREGYYNFLQGQTNNELFCKRGLIIFNYEDEKPLRKKANSRFSAWGSSCEQITRRTNTRLEHPRLTWSDTGNRGYIHKRSTLRHHLHVESCIFFIGRTAIYYLDGKRIAKHVLPQGWVWKVESRKTAYIYNPTLRIEYHPDSCAMQKSTRYLIYQALRNLIKRNRVKVQKEKEEVMLHRIFVTREDSLKAGNCTAMTDKFIQEVRFHIQKTQPDAVLGGEFALSAKYLLARRKDAFTKRAVQVAMRNIPN